MIQYFLNPMGPFEISLGLFCWNKFLLQQIFFTMELWKEEGFCGYCPCNLFDWQWRHITVKNEWKRLYMGTIPANFCHWPLTMELWLEEVICGYGPCKFLSLTMNYDWKRLFVGTVPANFYHWWVKSLLTVAPSNSEPWNYEWKRLYVGTVPANSCHWPLTIEL